MTLWKRAVAIAVVGVALALLALVAAQRLVVLRSFSALERSDTELQVQRTLNALQAEIRHLDILAHDWAAWDEMVAFVQDGGDEFRAANLLDETFATNRTNVIIIADAEGRLVFSRAFELDSAAPLDLPEYGLDRLSPNHPLLAHANPDSAVTGVVLLAHGPLLVASRPIVTSQQQGPIRGTLIVGRLVDEGLARQLAETVQLHLDLYRGDAAGLPPDQPDVAEALADPSGPRVRVLDAQTVAGYAMLNGIDGRPALLVRVEQPRVIYAQGLSSFRFLGLIALAVAVVLVTLSLVVLYRSVFARLRGLSGQVSRLGETADLARRVNLPGQDEVSDLGQRINVMLSDLQRAEESSRQRQRYVEALAEAGQALLAAGSEIPYESFLQTLGDATGASQVYVYLSSRGAGGELLASERARWRSRDRAFVAYNPRFQNYPALSGGFGRWAELLSQGKAVQGSVTDFPPQERAVLEAEGIQAILALPLVINGELAGFMGLDQRESVRPWEPSQVDMLRAAAADLAQAISRQRAEQELRWERDFSAQLVDASPAFVAVIHADGAALMMNGSLLRALGYTLDQVAGRDYVTTFVPEEDQAAVRRSLHGASARATDSHQSHLRASDGRRILIEWLTKPIYRDDGSLDYFLFVGVDSAERKRVEDALRQTKLVLEHSPVVLFRWSADGGVTFVSENIAQFGYSAADLTSGRLHFRDIVHRDDLPRLLADSRRLAVAAQKSQHREYRLVTADGQVRWIDDRTLVLRDKDGKVEYSDGVLVDVTERRQAEAEIAAWKMRYDMTVASSCQIVYDYDIADGSIVWGGGMEPVLGYTLDEMSGGLEQWKDLLHPDDRLQVLSRLRQAESTRAHTDSEYRMRHKDGSYRWMHDRGLFTAAAGEQPVRMLGMMRDVTVRKAAEEQLLRMKEFNEGIVLGVAEGLVVEDADGIVTFVNPALETLLGYRAEEVVGAHWSALVVPREVATVSERVAQRSSGASEQYETWLLHKDGREIPVLLSARPLFKDGAYAGVLTACTDISSRKQAEAERDRLEVQLREAQKLQAIGQLAGGVAHEFNNMMTVILGNAELALELEKKSRSIHSEIQAIHKTGKRAAALTQQLLAFGRRQILQPTALDLSQAVTDTVTMFGHVVGEGIEVRVELADGLAPVRADRAALSQVLTNLVLNARDAMPQGGVLTVRTEQVRLDAEALKERPGVKPGAFVRLTVADSGTGMDEATLQRLFEPFFTTKELGKGSGLGLAVVYGIMQQHQGWVDVRSQPGQGTRFDLYFPAHDLPPDRAPVAALLASLEGSETVLLAEDEKLVRSLASDMLASLGYKVLEAKDGREAFDLFAADPERFDIAVLDAVMPRLSGVRAYEAMLKLRPKLPVLFISGYSAEISGVPGPSAQVHLLPKPFAGSDLARAVRTVLDQVE